MNKWTPIIALCLVSLLLACGGKKDDEQKKDSSSSGSSKPEPKQESDLHGDWKVDMDQFIDDQIASDDKMKDAKPEKLKQFREMMSKMAMSFKIEEGKFRIARKMGEKTRPPIEVSWKVTKKTDDTHWTLETKEKKKDGTWKDPEVMEVEWISNDHVKFILKKKDSKVDVFHLKR